MEFSLAVLRQEPSRCHPTATNHVPSRGHRIVVRSRPTTRGRLPEGLGKVAARTARRCVGHSGGPVSTAPSDSTAGNRLLGRSTVVNQEPRTQRYRCRRSVTVWSCPRFKVDVQGFVGAMPPAREEEIMLSPATSSEREIAFRDQALEVCVSVSDDGVARLGRLVAKASDDSSSAAPDSAGRQFLPGLPLIDVITTGSGRAWSGGRYIESVTGGRLRYSSSEQCTRGRWQELTFRLEDPDSGLRVEVAYRVLKGGGVLRASARLENAGSAPVAIEAVTSFVASGLAGPGGTLGDLDIYWADNCWLGENRWQQRAFRNALADLNRSAHGTDSREMFGLTSEGSWSSGRYLPMGAAVNRRTNHAFVWQIEHNGGWHWQVGEHTHRDGPSRGDEQRTADEEAAYVALLGPTDAEHHWRLILEPGEFFETVPVAIALSTAGLEGALARLTEYRRASRRPHDDHRRLPVVFNDFMNTLMGDPTTERLLPLVAAAARVGAEYFCIDSGWYAELGETWWETLGTWRPSKGRFPNGITEVLDSSGPGDGPRLVAGAGSGRSARAPWLASSPMRLLFPPRQAGRRAGQVPPRPATPPGRRNHLDSESISSSGISASAT